MLGKILPISMLVKTHLWQERTARGLQCIYCYEFMTCEVYSFMMFVDCLNLDQNDVMIIHMVHECFTSGLLYLHSYDEYRYI